MLLALAFRPVAQLYECNAHILALSPKTEARNAEDRPRILLFILQIKIAQLPHGSFRFLKRGTGRERNLVDDAPLVLSRKEARRQTQEQETHADDDHGVDQHGLAPVPLAFLDARSIVDDAAVEGSVEPAEKSLLRAMAFALGAQDRGAQGRRQNQRDKNGEDHR